jgi:putative oxidoreductase
MTPRGRRSTTWPIRLVVGAGLAYHGAPKLFTARGHENISSMLTQMKIPLPELAGWGVGVIEFAGGVALLANWRTRVVAGLVVGEVVANLASAAARGGFPVPLPGGQPLPGWEASFFYGAGALTLLLAAPQRPTDSPC